MWGLCILSIIEIREYDCRSVGVGFIYAFLICGSRIVGVLVWGLCIHY